MKKNILAILSISLFACNHQMVSGPSLSLGKDYNTEGRKIIVYTTADNTNLRLTPTDTLQFKNFGQPLETQICVFVDPAKTFQTFFGIGGALTDASAETFAKLPKEKQQEFMQAYFDKNKGIGYTLARTNIQSCDFSSGSYSYVQEGDSALKTFSIDHDKQFRIPFIKQHVARWKIETGIL